MNILEGVKYQELNKGQFIKGSNYNSVCTGWDFKKRKYQLEFKKTSELYRGISGIYAIAVGKGFYIGSSKNLCSRLIQHLSDLNANRNNCKKLQRAFNKYQYIKVSIIELCEEKMLITREQFYIDSLTPRYNIRKIADRNTGVKFSEEAIQKLRARNLDPERMKKFKEFNPGRFKSEETRKKLAEARKRQQIDPETQREGWRKFKETEDYDRWLEATRLNGKRRSETIKLEKEKLRKDKIDSGTHKEQLRLYPNGEEKLFLVKRSTEKEELIEEIKKLSLQGVRVRDIVKLLGVTKNFVVDTRRRKIHK